MTLTEIVQLINRSKKLIIPLFLIALLGAVGIHFLQQRQLPTEKLPSPAEFEGSTLPPSVQLKRGLKVAKWGDVYQIRESDLPLTKDWAEAVAKKFGFTSSPRVAEEKSFIWSDARKWLSLDESDLRYGLDLLNDPSLVGAKEKPLPSESEADETVRQFLVEKGFNAASRLALLKTSLVAVRGPHWLDVAAEDEANAVHLVMTEKIEDVPILVPGAEGSVALSAYVGREGKILKLSYSSWGERDYELFDRYPLRSLSEALTAGKVVDVMGEGWEMTVELQSLLVTSVSLAYFADSSTGFVYPIFVFQGSGSDNERKTFQVTVLAPAVSSKWLE